MSRDKTSRRGFHRLGCSTTAIGVAVGTDSTAFFPDAHARCTRYAQTRRTHSTHVDDDDGDDDDDVLPQRRTASTTHFLTHARQHISATTHLRNVTTTTCVLDVKLPRDFSPMSDADQDVSVHSTTRRRPLPAPMTAVRLLAPAGSVEAEPSKRRRKVSTQPRCTSTPRPSGRSSQYRPCR